MMGLGPNFCLFEVGYETPWLSTLRKISLVEVSGKGMTHG